jgi:hypothetical protein
VGDRPGDQLVDLLVANTGDRPMTTVRLTYDQLAERTGRSPEGARMMARRKRWRIERGNDGKARVIVDEPELVVQPPERTTGRPPGHLNGERPADHPANGSGELVAELRARLDKTEGEASEFRQQVTNLQVEVADLRVQAAKAQEQVVAARAVAIADVATAQADAAAKDAVVAELRAQIEREIARGDALAAQLAEARRPWWRRWIG